MSPIQETNYENRHQEHIRNAGDEVLNNKEHMNLISQDRRKSNISAWKKKNLVKNKQGTKVTWRTAAVFSTDTKTRQRKVQQNNISFMESWEVGVNIGLVTHLLVGQNMLFWMERSPERSLKSGPASMAAKPKHFSTYGQLHKVIRDSQRLWGTILCSKTVF